MSQDERYILYILNGFILHVDFISPQFFQTHDFEGYILLILKIIGHPDSREATIAYLMLYQIPLIEHFSNTKGIENT